VAVGIACAGWLADVPEITASEAVEVAEDAFAGAGVDAAVAAEPVADTYVSRSQRSVEVWRVRATVRDAPIDVLLARSGAQPVAIDDRSADGTAYVLSEAEYDSVAGRVDDPALERRVARNIALTLAAGLVVVAATLLVLVAERPETR
jgi:hypothetical protein